MIQEHKRIQESYLQKLGVVEGWKRSFKAELILSTKAEHDGMALIHDRLRGIIEATRDDDEALPDRVKAMVDVSKALANVRAQLFELGALPCRPRHKPVASGKEKAGDSAEPVEAVEVSMPRPEADKA